eukprot:3689900-Amphidinium_carterae.1
MERQMTSSWHLPDKQAKRTLWKRLIYTTTLWPGEKPFIDLLLYVDSAATRTNPGCGRHCKSNAARTEARTTKPHAHRLDDRRELTS